MGSAPSFSCPTVVWLMEGGVAAAQDAAVVAVFMGEWGGGYAGGCSAVNVKEI